MTERRTRIALLLAGAVVLASPVGAAPKGAVVAIVGATVFDGTGAAPRAATVIIENGRIRQVGAGLTPPRGATVIDARGKALLPGFYDLHTHWTPAGNPATTPQIATAYVAAGVTTVNDFHEQPESYAPRRAWLSTLVAPHVNFAARISTPGGHGADWGDQSTTIWINTPDAARAAIAKLKPYQPDLIKAFTDGWRYGLSPDNTSMDEWTLRALTDAAHKEGLEVLTHTVTVDRGAIAARAGVDALAHGLQDRELDPKALFDISASKMALAPTLAVYEPNKPGSPPLDRTDPKVAPRFVKFGYALKNVKTMYDAGVRVGLGTDAGMPGTPHGRSTLREMELLVQAGLTPTQALVAATSASARIMHQDGDRGTIAPGQRADIVLIDGKPWDRIADVHKVSQVLIDGRPVYGTGAPALPAANLRTQLASVTIGRLVDDFERADQRSSLDTLRLETPDGGMDRSLEISQVVPRDDGGHALSVSAKLSIKEDPYAGVAIPLTRGSVQGVDLRGYTGVRVDIRGDGAYALKLNGFGRSWTAPVKAASGWTTVDVPFSALKPVAMGKRAGTPWTADGIVQVELGATRDPGERIWMQIDNVRFY
ncbi:CIA30 family protein [Sphingomonas arantia]|uniref:CIA30 family protein n=1 Tax=Sphingomonas arantia TaxID=1460676 RepID=A0ABW4U2U0_9SPHN